MMINFIKMHGAGNDFVIIDTRKEPLTLEQEKVVQICDRHLGVGCDQLILIEESKKADCFMRIYNPDGSESGACGNATRCVGQIVMKETKQDAVTIETLAGILEAKKAEGDKVSVNMGAPKLEWRDIPLSKAQDTANVQIELGELAFPVAVNMGNPHLVFFVEDVDAIDLAYIGPKLENHPLLPERANIGIAQMITHYDIKLRVWERGAGETLACGSGACAALVAAYRRGIAEPEVTVHLPGGDLKISWEVERDNAVWMAGEVAKVFSGRLIN